MVPKSMGKVDTSVVGKDNMLSPSTSHLNGDVKDPNDMEQKVRNLTLLKKDDSKSYGFLSTASMRRRSFGNKALVRGREVSG